MLHENLIFLLEFDLNVLTLRSMEFESLIFLLEFDLNVLTLRSMEFESLIFLLEFDLNVLTLRSMEFETHYDSDSDSCDEDPFMGAVGVYERMLNQVDILMGEFIVQFPSKDLSIKTLNTVNDIMQMAS